jgi:hypothetical protein
VFFLGEMMINEQEEVQRKNETATFKLGTLRVRQIYEDNMGDYEDKHITNPGIIRALISEFKKYEGQIVRLKDENPEHDSFYEILGARVYGPSDGNSEVRSFELGPVLFRDKGCVEIYDSLLAGREGKSDLLGE